MGIFSRLGSQLADGRFDANLIGFYGLVVLTVIGSLVLRRLLARGGSRLVRWTALFGMHAVGEEAVRHARTLLFWCTAAAVLVLASGGIGYHTAGRDLRADLGAWYDRLTAEQVVHVAAQAAGVIALGLAAWSAVWLARRLLPFAQARVKAWFGCSENETVLARWFRLLERYAVAAVRLSALWTAGQVVGLGDLASATVGFVLRVITILAVARLLTLASKAVSKPVADLGDRYLGKTHFRRYWERVTRLFSFGQRCFEAAVYVSAASMCVAELHFIAIVADFGPKVVQCIGIVFGTRVFIELLQVLFNEAFGLYDEGRVIDQKGRTLVPLLGSVSQYVLYFGSVVVMLGVLGIDTRPILAGAGILGLAVGLGAQNLVTDVVSGFFILFENQYLVGDFVQIGDASGTVEAVGIRLTQIRDGQGKLHIIPNGQIKGVVNYSKGYVNAVVDMRVPSGSDLEGVFRAMTDAGKKLQQARKEVLEATVIQGVVELGALEMTVRAVTKVQPGTHVPMQNEYRRLLKQTMDQAPAGERLAKVA